MKKMLSSITSLLDISGSYSEGKRRQRLFDILLGIYATATIIIFVLTLFISLTGKANHPEEVQAVIFYCLITFFSLVILFILNHSKIGFLARLIFVAFFLLLAVITDTPAEVADGRGLLKFSLPIIAAGVLFWPSTSFILAIISSAIVGYIAYFNNYQPLLSVIVFFLLATLTWLETSSLENQIKRMKEVNVAIKESEERYRTLVEISPDMVVLTDLSGEIIVVNQAGLSLFGFTNEEEVRGKKIFDFIADNDRQRSITEFGKMAEQMSTAKVEYRAQTQQGTNFDIEINASVLRDPAGNPQAVLSIGRDVTLRKKMEQALLAEKDEAYRALVNNSTQGLVLLQNGCILLANAAIANCLGLTVEEMYALPADKIFDFVHPEDRQIGYLRMQERLQGKPVPASYETRIMHKNGAIRWLELRPTVITLDGLPAIQITAIDITERKNAEESMQMAHDRLKAILNTLPDLLFELDREQRFCNFRAMKSMSFIPAHQSWLGKTVQDAFPANAARVMSAALEDALIHGQHRGATYDVDMPDGKLSFELSISTLGDMNSPSGRFIVLVRDITERNRANEAIKESEKRYRDLFENASLAVFQSGLDGKVIAVNPAFARMFGYQSPEEVKELIKDSANIFAAPQRRAEIISIRTEDQNRNVFENIYLRKDGSTFVGQLTIRSIMDEAGQVQCFEGFIEDITLRKETEKALRESEERYRSLAEAAHDIIVIVAPDTRIEYVNKFAAEKVGIAPEKIIGLQHSQFFSPETNKRHRENLTEVFKHGLPMYTESQTQLSSGEIWLSNWMVPLKDETGVTRKVLTISRDISERKALEMSLIETKNSLEKRVIERTADLNKSREQLRKLTRETVLAQENERRRLSRELHDEAGQGLVGLAFSLGEILSEIPDELENVREKTTKTLERIDKLNQRIRGMAHGLRPPILDVAGIDLALRGFCRDFSAETRFLIIYNGTDNLPPLSEEISITLYRIVQEAITNVVKHGHATEAHVSLNYDTDCITLTIRDNGIGFDTTNTSKGVGLAGMEERLGLLGGRLEIASHRKHGTRLKAIIPLKTGVTNP
jgi:PAS domain S-box-containing protein